MLNYQIIPYDIRFARPAQTSRGVYHSKRVWYILLFEDDNPQRCGVGECAPLYDLSPEYSDEYPQYVEEATRSFCQTGRIDYDKWKHYPSILFGLETAWKHYQTRSYALFETPFSRGEAGIPINGLIWMGEADFMHRQIEAKLQAGFRCVKLKIGGIDFEEEIQLLSLIRSRFSKNELELRVDANGAFQPEEALDKLKRLAALDIHSIEQPIRAGQWEQMAELTATSPIPIALDEEMIGCVDEKLREELLDRTRPHYIVLKPSLHGGLYGCKHWIQEAEKRGIGWWVTSALESNIGLNAIAQWCATFDNPLPQGLGTGQLFVNNIPHSLGIRQDCLWFSPAEKKESVAVFDVRYEGVEAENISRFLQQWQSDSPFVTLQTSGSTGSPKQMHVLKEKLCASARMTCSFLQLKKEDKALLCLPVQYIAGRMMMVRALESELKLIAVEPSGHPLANLDESVDFAAMIPLQVYNSLEVPEETELLNRIRILLIGGSGIDPRLEERLQALQTIVYASYGMTETLSHIALRKVNGSDASLYFTPMKGVSVSLTDEGTLRIDAPHLSDSCLETTDMAEILPDGRFRIIGRKDNVINSGGIKIQTEVMESVLSTIFSFNFAITSVRHPSLGEAVTLLAEMEPEEEQMANVRKILPKNQWPKYVLKVDKVPLTENGKTDRVACKMIAAKRMNKHE